EAAAAGDLHHALLATPLAPPGEPELVARVTGHAEPDRDLAHHRLWARPVADVPLHQPGRGEDVEEDVLPAALDGPVTVVVDVLEVPGRDRGGDHERRGDVDHQLGQDGGCPVGTGLGGHRRSSRQAGSVSSASTSSNATRTGRPMCTRSGSMSSSSPTMRTPSMSWTSAMTMGSRRPGTGG